MRVGDWAAARKRYRRPIWLLPNLGVVWVRGSQTAEARKRYGRSGMLLGEGVEGVGRDGWPEDQIGQGDDGRWEEEMQVCPWGMNQWVG